MLSEFGKHSLGLHGARSKCKACTSLKNSGWYHSNSEKKLTKNKEWLGLNRSRHSQLVSDWYIANKDRYFAKKAADRAANPEKHKQKRAKYARENKAALAITQRFRRGVCKMATPSWADQELMNRIYELADRYTSETGVQHHVDHLVPLISPRVQSLDFGNPIRAFIFIGPLIPVVQGFHCQANLSIKPARENIIKSNRYWPDMPAISL